MHPVDLLVAAANLALDDAGIAAHRVGGVLATPLSTFSTDDASQLVAERLGLPPGLRSVTGYTGAGPQQLMARACQAIIDGSADAVLIVGGIADASVRRARRLGTEPPAPPTSRWSQGTGAPVLRDVREDAHHRYHARIPEIAAGGGMPSAYFALIESSLAAGPGTARTPGIARPAAWRRSPTSPPAGPTLRGFRPGGRRTKSPLPPLTTGWWLSHTRN